jgi:cytochrome c
MPYSEAKRIYALSQPARWLVAAIMLLVPAVTSAAPAGDPVKGKAVFARCAICHSVEPRKNVTGPSLANIIGRAAGAVPGFKFSPAVKNSKIRWTPQTLDKYLASPRTYIPGNRMFFAGLPNAADRANVIAYLGKPVK